MTPDDRKFMMTLCGKLEAAFASISAGFEGFVSPHLGGERDGFLVVEVFNVPEEQMEEVLGFGERLAYDHLMAGGGFVTLSPWTPEETRQHFPNDLLRINLMGSAMAALHEAEDGDIFPVVPDVATWPLLSYDDQWTIPSSQSYSETKCAATRPLDGSEHFAKAA